MKILLVTPFYAPLNSIAATRLVNFCKYLKKNGHSVDVLTRHYSEDLLNEPSLAIALNSKDHLEGSYDKKDNVIYVKYSSHHNSKLSISRKLPPGLRGGYNMMNLDVFQYGFVEKGLEAYEKIFGEKSHDVIIASSPHPASLILAQQLNKTYGIKWVADFRDSYIATEDKRHTRFLKALALNRIIKSASGILFVSEGMKTQNLKFFSAINRNKKNTIVYNGFEPSNDRIDPKIIDEVQNLKNEKDVLLVYTGSLYKERNLNFFLSALRKYEGKSIGFIVAGIQEEFKRNIKANYSDIDITFIDKVNYATAIKIQKMADFLLLTIWKNNYTGFSGKIFEYLYTENKIILDYKAPQDLADYLRAFKNIYYCNEDVKMFQSILNDNTPKFSNTPEQLEVLSREFQVNVLNKFLSEV